MFKKVTWLIVVRLCLVTLFLGLGGFVFKIDKILFYFLIAFIYFLSLIYLFWLVSGRHLFSLLVSQIISDSILITVIVMYTGSLDSIFVGLYILNILIAAIVAGPMWGMVVTGIVSFLYVLQALGIYYTDLFPISCSYKEWPILFYTLHVHIVTFVLVGILSSFLSRKMNQMEEKIKEKERFSVMGRFAAQIAHEIRNPLAAISGSVELLKESLNDGLSYEQNKLMQSVVEEAGRVSRVFEEFLDYSKIDNMHFEDVCMNKLLDEVVLSLTNRLVKNGIEVVKTYGEKDIIAECDYERMRHVVYNIINNAVDAMENSGGVLELGVSSDAAEVAIYIKDNGGGLNKEARNSLFKPFKTTKKNGIGLGLVISDKIVRKHKGSIDFQDVDGGALVAIKIPKHRW